MSDPIKSDQVAYASSPYLKAYLQKQRMAQAAGAGQPQPQHRGPLVRGHVVAYETPPQVRGAAARRKNGEAAAEGKEKRRPHGGAPMEDRPIDRLHQFEAERGMGEWSQDGPREADENPYDDSSDDTPYRDLKAPRRPDER